jgi:hypothetical protein
MQQCTKKFLFFFMNSAKVRYVRGLYVNWMLRFRLAVGCWLLAVGGWLLAVGGWLLAVGGWRLAVGFWLLAVGF